MKLSKTFDNVVLDDQVLQRGLIELASCFEAHGVGVDLRRLYPPRSGSTGASITLTIRDAVVKEDFTEFAKDVQFFIDSRNESGRIKPRGIVDVSRDKRLVCNLSDPLECADFAMGLLQKMRNRGTVSYLPELGANLD